MGEAGTAVLEDAVHGRAIAEVLGHDQALQAVAPVPDHAPDRPGQVLEVLRVAVLPRLVL